MYTNLTAVQYCIQILLQYSTVYKYTALYTKLCMMHRSLQLLHTFSLTSVQRADQHSHGNIMQRHNIMMQSSWQQNIMQRAMIMTKKYHGVKRMTRKYQGKPWPGRKCHASPIQREYVSLMLDWSFVWQMSLPEHVRIIAKSAWKCLHIWTV